MWIKKKLKYIIIIVIIKRNRNIQIIIYQQDLCSAYILRLHYMTLYKGAFRKYTRAVKKGGKACVWVFI